METQSGRAKQVFKWLGLLVGGMMMLGGSLGALSNLIVLPFSIFVIPIAFMGLGMSALIIWLGWKLIVATGTAMSPKMAMKLLLLMTGGMMLVGGGICAVADTYFLIAGGFRKDVVFLIFLTGISCLIAWAGWWAIKFSGSGQSAKPGNESAKEKDCASE